jgi:hypothetical protein
MLPIAATIGPFLGKVLRDSVLLCCNDDDDDDDEKNR